MKLFTALILIIAASTSVFVIGSVWGRLSRWNRTYDRLGKRYSGKSNGKGGIIYGFGLVKPSLTFNYGRTFCTLRNRKSARHSTGRSTELSMIWPNKKLKLEIASAPSPNRRWGQGTMKTVEVDSAQLRTDFYITSNQPAVALDLLNNGVQWQIEQLRRHMGNNEVIISISRGSLLVSKPGYIKEHLPLEDFVCFSLNLFDQLMLVNAQGISFINENEASIVSDVKCPICSEEILQNMVVCTRCKTPHCRDCWKYNGQCATFACSETRFLGASSSGG
ncbi:MAG: RING finger protein [Mariniblastus sp.]|nr:RING finger protein [Mariniblastus sp.]